MIPERQGNRMDAEIDTSKTEALGWKPKWSIKDYLISQ
jgi:UDP-glucose 4-epimerase